MATKTRTAARLRSAITERINTHDPIGLPFAIKRNCAILSENGIRTGYLNMVV